MLMSYKVANWAGHFSVNTRPDRQPKIEKVHIQSWVSRYLEINNANLVSHFVIEEIFFRLVYSRLCIWPTQTVHTIQEYKNKL